MPPSALIGRGCPLAPAARCKPATARDDRHESSHEWLPGHPRSKSVRQATGRCSLPTATERRRHGHSDQPSPHPKRRKAGLHAGHNTRSDTREHTDRRAKTHTALPAADRRLPSGFERPVLVLKQHFSGSIFMATGTFPAVLTECGKRTNPLLTEWSLNHGRHQHQPHVPQRSAQPERHAERPGHLGPAPFHRPACQQRQG